MTNDWFSEDGTEKYDLGDGQHIEYKKEIPYDEFIALFKDVDPDNPGANVKMAKPLLEAALVGWKLKDKDGKFVEFSKEAVGKLSAKAIFIMATPIIQKYNVEKKSSKLSGQMSSMGKQEKG